MKIEDEMKLQQAFNQPSPFSAELIAHLRPHMEFRQFSKNQNLPREDAANEPMCYVLQEGYLTAHRQVDDLLMRTVAGPTLLGLGSNIPLSELVYFRTMTDCVVGLLPKAEALEIIDRENLWKALSQHLLIVIDKLYLTQVHLTAPSAYEVLRSQLISLMNEPEAYRANKFAAQYLLERTQLSRSRVMKILSDLRQGGFITIENGYLVSISHLPEKY